MKIAARETQAPPHDDITTVHLLLALVHEGQGVAPQVLTRLGADPEVVERDLTP